MKKLLIRILAIVLPALMACGCASDLPEPGGAGDSEIMLRVSLRKTDGGVATRAGDYSDFEQPLPPGETIETLRYIILDSDGAVEHNTFLNLGNVTEDTQVFKVKGNDYKRVYVIANEQELTLNVGGTNVKATDYLRQYTAGTKIDKDLFDRLVIPYTPNVNGESGTEGWNNHDTRQIPMAAIKDKCYIPLTTSDSPEPVDVQLFRAAVKYSFRIINDSPEPVSVEGLVIGRMADREYLFPTNTVYGENDITNNTPVPTQYATPDGTKSFTSVIPLSNVRIPGKEKDQAAPEYVARSVYYLEGKNFAGTDSVYWATLKVNGVELEQKNLKWYYRNDPGQKLRDMKDLPRNTHVIIEAKIKDSHTLEMVACVEPYASVELDPWFGLERDENGNIIYRDPDGWLVSSEGYHDPNIPYKYVDAYGQEANVTGSYEETVDGKTVTHVTEVTDKNGYKLSKNGYPLDSLGREGYRDAAGVTRDTDGYLMNVGGLPIDKSVSPEKSGKRVIVTYTVKVLKKNDKGEVEVDSNGNVQYVDETRHSIIAITADEYLLSYDGLKVNKNGETTGTINDFKTELSGIITQWQDIKSKSDLP